MRISNPFRYQFRQPANAKSSILKLWFGSKKYYIIKAKSAMQTVNSLSIEIDRRMRLGTPDGHIYEKVIKYILRARVNVFEVEVLLQSDKPLELLKAEYKALRAGIGDPDCLNSSFDAYIPTWIPGYVVKKFETWVKTLNKKPVIAKKNESGNTKAAAKKSKDNKTVSPRRNTEEKGSVRNRVGGGLGAGRKKENTGPVKKESKRNSNK